MMSNHRFCWFRYVVTLWFCSYHPVTMWWCDVNFLINTFCNISIGKCFNKVYISQDKTQLYRANIHCKDSNTDPIYVSHGTVYLSVHRQMFDHCKMKRNSHVTSEPAEVIVGVLTLNTTVEVLKGPLYSLENTHTQQIQSNLHINTHRD